jgi:hypothetical protein
MANYFEVLNGINVNDKVEKKNGLSYLSWAYAWGEVKKRFPDATFTVYENAQGWNYHTDGRTCWVKTGVTVSGIEHIEHLPVMDHRNNSIPLDKVTSFDVNKAIQRALTKACARHGLGLYVYAGEDLPDDLSTTQDVTEAPAKKKAPKAAPKPAQQVPAASAPDDPRVELREFIRTNGLDGSEIARVCGLNNNSTAADFENALIYAKTLII